MEQQQPPKNITARFSISLEDQDDIIVASRVRVDNTEAKVPVFLVVGGLVVAEGLDDPATRATYAGILFKASQSLALGLLKEAGAVKEKAQEGSVEPPAPSQLADQ